MIASHKASKRFTLSMMLSSTRKRVRAPWSRASRMSANHAIEGIREEVAATHLDDRAETAIVGAAARSFDHVDLTSQKGVALEDTRHLASGRLISPLFQSMGRTSRIVHPPLVRFDRTGRRSLPSCRPSPSARISSRNVTSPSPRIRIVNIDGFVRFWGQARIVAARRRSWLEG